MAVDSAAAIVTTRSLTKRLIQSFNSAPIAYPSLCMIMPSNGKDEEYGMLGAVPQMREWVAGRQSKTLRASKYTLTNKLFESTIEIEKTDFEDDRLGLYEHQFSDLGLRAAQHPDELMLSVMVAGASTACFDGQYFFDTDHSWGDSGTQSNALTYDAASHTAVTALEFKAAFDASVVAMLGFKDDRGQPFYPPTVGRLSDLTIVVPTALRGVAYQAFGATIISSTSNVIVDMPNIICSPYLTSGVKFYTFYTGASIKPFIFQPRRALASQWKGMDDRQEKQITFMCDARYAVGYGAWWNAVQTTFN